MDNNDVGLMSSLRQFSRIFIVSYSLPVYSACLFNEVQSSTRGIRNTQTVDDNFKYWLKLDKTIFPILLCVAFTLGHLDDYTKVMECEVCFDSHCIQCFFPHYSNLNNLVAPICYSRSQANLTYLWI